MTRYILLLIAMVLLPVIGYSQTTGATIEGAVMTAEGQPLPGANVVAIHQPTGTRYGTATRANGSYTLNSVRVGGPYIIKVTFIGYNAAKKELEDIDLGETIDVNFTLQEGNIQLEELTVIGSVNPVFNENVTGAKTHISTIEIERAPSISRSLQDFLRLSPMASGSNSFGGANDRYNSLLIDGATLDDVFGLGEATPGSQAGVESPISIDAIAELNVAIAPFGVKNGSFNGAQINAVTRSGQNKYVGSVYFYSRSEALSGNYIRDNGLLSDDLEEFQQRFYGLRLGGPIVKDELFFFVSAELKQETSPITTLLGSAPDEFPLDPPAFAELSQIAQSQYSYDPGGYGSRLSTDQDNVKFLVKLNWNINTNNKLMFRYNYLNATDQEGINRSPGSYSFANRRYNFKSKLHSFVLELNTDISNNMFNTFRAVYTRIRDTRNVADQAFPEVNISFDADEPQCEFCSIYMGIDRFSQKNELFQDLIEITDNLTYIRGDHEFTFGTSNKLFYFSNLFVQDAFGTYEFRGNGGNSVIENFREADPYEYRLSYLLPGGNPRAEFSGLQFGLYAQDRWTVNDRLTVTLGLRVDVPFMPKTPTFNPDVPDAFPGFSTSRVASGNPLWSPRFGFNWDLSTDETMTQIRGGVGVFSGPPPFVWISNQYSNTGVDYGRLIISDYFGDNGYVNVIGPGFFSGDPNNQPNPLDDPNLIPISTTAVNLISEDFKYPQSLKFNLAIDQELPNDIIFTLEGLYSNALNAVVFKNLNVNKVATSVHGRPLYDDPSDLFTFANADYVNPGFTNVILLDNTDKGYRYSVSAQLQKQFYSGLSVNVAYTYTIAKSVNSGNSSRAISNWQFNESVDPNNPGLGITDYNRRHRFFTNISYRLDWAKGWFTTITAYLTVHSGTPFSWVYFGNANGDTQRTNDLIYVPEIADFGQADDVVLIADNPEGREADWQALNAFINSHPSLARYRGEFVPRNNATTPWETFLDMRISQTIPTFNGQSLELTLSMFNVLNFINEKWGLDRSVSFNSKTAWTFEEYVDQAFINNPDNAYLGLTSEDIGKPVISFDPFRVYESAIYNIRDVSSVWRAQLGIRYNF